MSWKIDNSHAEVSFTVRHLLLAKVRGVFHDFEASLDLNEVVPEDSQVSVRIATASVDTGTVKRDAHLKSPDFLDAENNPYMVFESQTVKRLSGDRFELAGDLTIRGQTHPMTLTGEIEGPVTDPLTGGRRLGFSLSGEIDRARWGLTWNMGLAGGVVVGPQIKIAIEAEVAEEAVPVAAAASSAV